MAHGAVSRLLNTHVKLGRIMSNVPFPCLGILSLSLWNLSDLSRLKMLTCQFSTPKVTNLHQYEIQTHTHTYMHACVYVYVCVCFELILFG